MRVSEHLDIGVTALVVGYAIMWIGIFTEYFFPMRCARPFHPSIQDLQYEFLSMQAPQLFGVLGMVFLLLGGYHVLRFFYEIIREAKRE